MIGVTFNVQNIATVLQVYDQIQMIRYDNFSETVPPTPIGQPVSLTDWTVVSGTADYPFPIQLETGTTVYTGYDPEGIVTDWYSSRYYDTNTGSYSAWSTPMLGSESDLYYDPVYPAEDDSMTPEEKAIVARLRIYIGDPIGLSREFGEEALASLHPDKKTFELSEKGWPVYITMGGKGFSSKFNPAVNGYKYLKFQEPVDDLCYTCLEAENLCGNETTKLLTAGIDIWYYTFRHSNKQLLAAYDSCPPPIGLSTTTATTQAYILQTAIDIITKELLEDAVEDGAIIEDDRTLYNPKPGLEIRKDLLAGLRKKLDDLVKTLTMTGITGVLID